MILLKCICFFSIIFMKVSFLEAVEYQKELIRHLFSNYDKLVRPVLRPGETVNVTVGMSLYQITELNEKSQILTTTGALYQSWTDYNLKWNESEFGDISVLHIPVEMVWHPDIILHDNANSPYKDSLYSSNAIINSNGSVFAINAAIFKTTCDFNVAYFPFDEQICILKFGSWSYDNSYVALFSESENVKTINYAPSNEWQLMSIHIRKELNLYGCCVEPFSEILHIIVLRRQSLFYVFNLILPCVLITLIAILSFYVPFDSGEKLTLGITTVLSMMVFLMFISEQMPPSADKLPLIGLYYGIMIFLVTLSTAFSIVTLNIHHRGITNQPVPAKLKRFVFGFLANVTFMKLEETNAPQIQQEKSITVPPVESQSGRKTTFHVNHNNLEPSMENFQKQVINFMENMQQNIERNEQISSEQAKRERVCQDWRQVAVILDRVLLIVFLIVIVGCTFAILFMSPHGNPFTM